MWRRFPSPLGDGPGGRNTVFRRVQPPSGTVDVTVETTPGTTFLDELNQRGLRPPLLVISDGAAGLSAQSTALWPDRCGSDA
jgi:hypothetical protein